MPNHKFIKVVTAVASLLCATTITLSAEQKAQGLSPKEIHTILRHPDGLRAIAKKLGHFTFNGNTGLSWVDSDYTWQNLVKNSTVIVDATLVLQASHLTDDGDWIDTTYTFTVIDPVKGDASKTVTFTVSGGKVTFDDGTWAEVETVAFDHLTVNSEYLLFLMTNQDGMRVPVGTLEGIWELSWKDSTVKPFASLDGVPHRLLTEVSNKTPAVIVSETKNMAAKQN